MFKYYSSYVLVVSCLTHFLCCGIPLFLGLASVFSNIFFLESISSNFEFLETVELFLFAIASLIFFLLLSLEIYNKKIKCVVATDCCTEEECNTTKKKIKYNIVLSSILYLFNTSLLLSEII